MCKKRDTKTPLTLAEVGRRCSECLKSLRFSDLEKVRDMVSSTDMPSVKVYLRRIEPLGVAYSDSLMSGEPKRLVDERDEAYRKLTRTLISYEEFKILYDNGCGIRSFMRSRHADFLENEYGMPGLGHRTERVVGFQ